MSVPRGGTLKSQFVKALASSRSPSHSAVEGVQSCFLSAPILLLGSKDSSTRRERSNAYEERGSQAPREAPALQPGPGQRWPGDGPCTCQKEGRSMEAQVWAGVEPWSGERRAGVLEVSAPSGTPHRVLGQTAVCSVNICSADSFTSKKNTH